MIEYNEILKKCKLFYDISDDDRKELLKCLEACSKKYKKDEFIIHSGEKITDVSIVLNGSVHIIKEDFWGTRYLLMAATAGEVFGETFPFAQTNLSPVSVLCNEDSEILSINFRKVITTCPSACVFHTKLIHNMIKMLAVRNVALTQKIEVIMKKTTREKLLSYLSAEAIKNQNDSFLIPFNRQQLADYLSVDRSAMSAELSKMQSEGLISYSKNHFKLF